MPFSSPPSYSLSLFLFFLFLPPLPPLSKDARVGGGEDGDGGGEEEEEGKKEDEGEEKEGEDKEDKEREGKEDAERGEAATAAAFAASTAAMATFDLLARRSSFSAPDAACQRWISSGFDSWVGSIAGSGWVWLLGDSCVSPSMWNGDGGVDGGVVGGVGGGVGGGSVGCESAGGQEAPSRVLSGGRAMIQATAHVGSERGGARDARAHVADALVLARRQHGRAKPAAAREGTSEGQGARAPCGGPALLHAALGDGAGAEAGGAAGQPGG